MRWWMLLPIVWAAVIAMAVTLISVTVPAENELANFATSLIGRTPAQRHNAKLAVTAINGFVVPPHGVFSFNDAVGPWTRDRGYKRAPVSYSGEVVITWGGGVCQVSSTLYNVALLAGMEIIERHSHVWAPLYVSPGRDAAVAYGMADLKFRNPYNEPVRIECAIDGDVLSCRLVSRARRRYTYRIVTSVQYLKQPPDIVRFTRSLRKGKRVRIVSGRPGYRVSVYRLIMDNERVIHRELISEDEYKAMSAMVKVGIGD